VQLVLVSAKTGVTGRARLLPHPDSQTPSHKRPIEFMDFGHLTLTGPCGSATAPVALDRCENNQVFRIVVGKMTKTSGSCTSSETKQESHYLDLLQRAQHYSTRGDTLLIHVQDTEQPLLFNKTSP
jgi:hypothetical protein